MGPPIRGSMPAHGKLWSRYLFAGLGFLCTGLGIVGLVLPLMPGTVFLIAAAWFFSKSSPRFEAWLLGHPRLGPHVLRWRRTGAIARRAKWLACGSMALGFALTVWSGAPPVALWSAGAILLASAAYVASRPEA